MPLLIIMASQPPDVYLSEFKCSACSYYWPQKTWRQPEVSHCTLTWVNQAGVTFILLVPAARDGITHHFFLSRAGTFNLIVFTTLPTHDVPLSSGAAFINDCVLWNRNQKVRWRAWQEQVRLISTLLPRSNLALQTCHPAWRMFRTIHWGADEIC